MYSVEGFSNFLLKLGLGLGVIFIAIGGIIIATSQGNEQKIYLGKKVIKDVFVAVVFMLSVKLLLTLLYSSLGG